MKNEKDLRLKTNYNSWWRGKKLFGENIDAAKNFYRQLLFEMDAFVKNKNDKILLDVACGTGEFLKEAIRAGYKVAGVDISNYAIAVAKKNVEGKLLVGSGEKLPFKSNTFDYVTCIGSLEHFSQPEKGVAEMSRVLKKTGGAAIHVPNLMFAGHIYMAYKYGVMPSEGGQGFSEVFYTYEGWKKLIENNGLRVLSTSVVNDMSKTKKVSMPTLLLWQLFLRHIVPFHLSYGFNFYCKKK